MRVDALLVGLKTSTHSIAGEITPMPWLAKILVATALSLFP